MDVFREAYRTNPVKTNNGTTQSTTQRAYTALREAIITGAIPPGERLKVEELKGSLSTGASPVREALSLLTSDQLVERRDQRGFRAASMNRQQFEEILKLRCQLEEWALGDSIKAADRAWEDKLVLAHHHMAKATGQPSDVAEPLHKNFHMALLSGCGSPILLRFCDQLYDLNIRYRYLAVRSKSYETRNVAGEHQGILDAAVNGDVDSATSKLTEHYQNTGLFLAELLDLS